MPARPARPCTYPGCAALVRDGGRRCAAHPLQQWTKSRQGTTTERGYGWAWQQLRVQILDRDRYLCMECQRNGRVRLATEVDHIVERADGGTDRPSNLQSLCSPCHKAKTDSSQASRRRGGVRKSLDPLDN